MRWVFGWMILLLLACSKSDVPKDVLPPEKMKVVLFDVIRADEFTTNFIANDSSANLKKSRSVLYDKVFRLHKTDKSTFYKSYNYYLNQPGKNKQLFDSLMMYAKQVREKPPVRQQEKLKAN